MSIIGPNTQQYSAEQLVLLEELTRYRETGILEEAPLVQNTISLLQKEGGSKQMFEAYYQGLKARDERASSRGHPGFTDIEIPDKDKSYTPYSDASRTSADLTLQADERFQFNSQKRCCRIF